MRSAIPIFVTLLLAEMVRGVGETFLSGAKDAWIADEVGGEAVGGIFLRTNQVRQIAGLAGILASVGLASIRLNLPYLVGGALYLTLTVFLLAVMPENGFHSTTKREQHVSEGERNTFAGECDTCKREHSTWRRMVGTLWDAVAAVRGRPVVVTRTLLLTSALGQTAGGPAVGAMGARYSIRFSMVMAALLLSPALAVYTRALTKKVASSALTGLSKESSV